MRSASLSRASGVGVLLLGALWAAAACDGSPTPALRQTRPDSDEIAPGAPGETASLPGRPEATPLPRLDLPDLTGRRTPLGGGPDEVTLINFWATWCVPCLKEIPSLEALHDRFKGRGLRVVGIAIESGDPADIRDFAQRHGMHYPILLADQPWARQHFGVIGLPVSLVVNRGAVIRRRLIGPQTGAQFQAAVGGYLESATQPAATKAGGDAAARQQSSSIPAPP